jgi:hypothetical protein
MPALADHDPPESSDPIFALIEAHREAWADYVAADHSAAPAGEKEELGRRADAAFGRLSKTAPTTLAGARAAIEHFIAFDEGCVPQRSFEYLETLLRAPIFAVEGLSRPSAAANVDDGESDPVFGVIEAHKKAAALLETTPTTRAGARAILRYLVEWDPLPEELEENGAYLKTLLRSPIFHSTPLAAKEPA